MPDRFRGGSRRQKVWERIASAQLALTANGTFVGNRLTALGGRTILRMLGEVTVGPTSAPTALDSVLITVGIGVVSDDAFALGPTALPDPGEDPEYPWLFWWQFPLFFAGTSVDGGNAQISGRKGFDIRSMRKMKNSESLGWVVQYEDVVGTPPIHLDIGTLRLLTLLP